MVILIHQKDKIGNANMKESIEFRGNWWLPDNPEKQLPGTLTFSQEKGGFLDLVGVFDTKETERVSQPKIILGINQQGKRYSLHNCHYNSWTYPISGLGRAVYRVTFIFEGVHFNAENEIKFHQICGNFTDQDAWVDTSGFTLEMQSKEGEPYNAIVQYTKPENRFLNISDGFEVGLGFSSKGPNWSAIQTEVTISQESYLIIKSLNGEVPFSEIYSLLDNFSDLLQIAAQRISYPIRIFGVTEANSESSESGKTNYSEVNIYFHPIEPYVDRKPKFPLDMLFTFNDLREDNIKQWFYSCRNHQTELKLYRTLFYSDRLFIETRFLNISQALESLHSNIFENQFFSTEDFRIQRDRVLNTVPEDLYDWAKGAINNANYKRFKEKIRELLDSKKVLFKKAIMNNEQFSKRVRDTRNEFVHHRELKNTFRDKEELYSAIVLLTYLFESFILDFIGFPQKQLEEIYKKRIDRYLSRWETL